MAVPFRHGRPVAVLRGGGFDQYGDPIGWTVSHVIEGCAWFPRTQGAGGSTESIDQRGREGLIEGLTLLVPFGADITHTDRVQLDGDPAIYEVDGEVGPWRSPHTAREPGMEVNLRRTEG